jgi:hypothetical protein
LILLFDPDFLKSQIRKDFFHLTGRNGTGHSPGVGGRIIL